MTMNRDSPLATTFLAALLTILGGCSDDSEQQLLDVTRNSLAQQIEQNTRLVDQSQSIIDESRQLTGAANELVRLDAEARRDLIAAQTQLTANLDQQRAAIQMAHEQLDQERQRLAVQRARDPIIAATIQSVGLAVVCLLPLIATIFIVQQLHTQEPDHAAVAELLILEMTSPEPLFLTQLGTIPPLTGPESIGERERPLIPDDTPSTPADDRSPPRPGDPCDELHC